MIQPGDKVYVVYWATAQIREVTYLGPREGDQYFDAEVYDHVEKTNRRTNMDCLYETREAAEKDCFVTFLKKDFSK